MMSMSDQSHWFGGHNSWLTFVGISAVMVTVLIPFIMFTLYKYCGVKIPISENQFHFGKTVAFEQSF